MGDATVKTALRSLLILFCAALSAPSARAFTKSSMTILNGAGGGYDAGLGTVVDASGNIYIAGVTTVATEDLWLVKYDKDLTFISSVTFDGSAGGGDDLQSIALGSDGNLYAAGRVNETVGGFNIYVGKFDTDLNLLSSATLDGGSSGVDAGRALALDSDGSVVVGGFVTEAAGGRNLFLGRWDSSLVLQSSATFDGLSSGSDEGWGVAVDQYRNVYLAGQVVEPSSGTNAFVGRFDSTLVLRASAAFDGASNDNGDIFLDVKVGVSSDVFAAGRARDGAANDLSAWLQVMSADLAFVSSATINGPGTGSDDFFGLLIDAGAHVFAMGTVVETASRDILIAEFDSNGVQLSSASFSRPGFTASDYGYTGAFDAGGNLLIPSELEGSGGDVDLGLLRLIVGSVSNVASSAGATLTRTLPGGDASVIIPAGAFTSDVVVTLQSPGNFPAASFSNIALQGAGVGLDIVVSPALQPVSFVTIVIPYRDQDVAGLDENRLLIARFDTGGNAWVPLFSTPDPAGNRVTALTDHLSVFQIMAVTPAEAVENVRPFPNPFRPGQGHTQVTFVNIPALSRIRLYTMTGEKIRDITANAAGVAVWDGRTQSGTFAAPGVYYGHAADGNRSKTFKIAVER